MKNDSADHILSRKSSIYFCQSHYIQILLGENVILNWPCTSKTQFQSVSQGMLFIGFLGSIWVQKCKVSIFCQGCLHSQMDANCS